ncbi:hypothetical protein FFLO_06078 [Filobasidium floriforme]|uniref:Uncharacterized protein n=1 Tax=Filobasidium floriforme TaxID=5210 RepID=A0A8K0NNC4_9TREE|nr:uncharacterized protein HD553DRAFT_355235 [Filobasidium floriforme]KAG7528522.1 hypothetical protein FFLO_06078 [Filobasidium floriforme]KAH8085317.1 hypothetical protein HD553DRAFT_355235 [Filobasidium floriforme]
MPPRRGPPANVGIKVTERPAETAQRAADRLTEQAHQEGYENPFDYVSSEVDRHLLMWPVAASRIIRLRVTLGYLIEYVQLVVKMDVSQALDISDFERFKKMILGYLEYRLSRSTGTKKIAASTLQHEKWDLIALIKFSALPEITADQHKNLVTTLSRVAKNMIRDHELTTKVSRVMLLGQKEIRLLLDNNFDESREHVFHLRLQDNVLLLFYFYTMARPGSLLATRPYPNKGLRWKDIKFYRHADGEELSDLDIVINIDNFKGHQLDTALEVEYDVRGTTDPRNLVFDLPVLLVALGCHRDIFENPEDIFHSDSAAITVKADHLNDPIFLGRTSRSGVGDQPMTYEASRVQFLANCTEVGLLSSGQKVTTYGIRKKMATENVKTFGYDITRKLMGHGSRSKALESHYDMSAYEVDMTGAALGEQSSTKVKLGQHPFIQAGFRRAAVDFTLQDAIDLDPECDLYRWYISELRHAFLTGSSDWKLLPFFTEGDTPVKAGTITETLRKLILRYRTRVNTLRYMTRVSQAELDLVQTLQEQKRLLAASEVPSTVPERLRKGLAEKEAKIAFEMNATGEFDNNESVKIRFAVPEPDPEMDDVEDDLEVVDSALEDEEDEAAAAASTETTTATVPAETSPAQMMVDEAATAPTETTTATVPAETSPAQMMVDEAATAPTETTAATAPTETTAATAPAKTTSAKINWLKDVIKTANAAKTKSHSKSPCMMCEEEAGEVGAKVELYTSRELWIHQAHGPYHSPAGRFDRWLKSTSDDPATLHCPLCNHETHGKGGRLPSVPLAEQHLYAKHVAAESPEMPADHQCYLRCKYELQFPTPRERVEFGWNKDRYHDGFSVERWIRSKLPADDERLLTDDDYRYHGSSTVTEDVMRHAESWSDLPTMEMFGKVLRSRDGM